MFFLAFRPSRNRRTDQRSQRYLHSFLAHGCCAVPAGAKREINDRKRHELVDSSAEFFSRASYYYSQFTDLPRLPYPSLRMYAHLDKGFAYSVKKSLNRMSAKLLLYFPVQCTSSKKL